MKEQTNAKEPIFRDADHHDDQGAGSRDADSGGVPELRLSPNTFYKFKSKYGGMNASDAVKLRALEDENAKLKRLLADAMLDNVVLKDLLGKP